MEMRVEGSFRPNQPDVEVAYALSGGTSRRVDSLHQLASSQVVIDATPDSVTPVVAGMMGEVEAERGGTPALVIQVHTHPSSVPLPSDADRQFFVGAARQITGQVPEARVLFAVHAVSREQLRRREKPTKVDGNEVLWTSVYREHRVAFYHPDANPCEVQLV
jgi:hypothetical protein